MAGKVYESPWNSTLRTRQSVPNTNNKCLKHVCACVCVCVGVDVSVGVSVGVGVCVPMSM